MWSRAGAGSEPIDEATIRTGCESGPGAEVGVTAAVRTATINRPRLRRKQWLGLFFRLELGMPLEPEPTLLLELQLRLVRVLGPR